MRFALVRRGGIATLVVLLVAGVRCSHSKWGGAFVASCLEPGCLCDPETFNPLECFTGKSQGGACKAGVRLCVNYHISPECLNEVTAKEEICNLADDDCNGLIDDGLVDASALFVCVSPGCSGKKVECLLDGSVGVCTYGMWKCTSSGGQKCVPLTSVASEACNNLDDNCNGQVDEKSCPVNDYCCTQPGSTIGICTDNDLSGLHDAGMDAPTDGPTDAEDDGTLPFPDSSAGDAGLDPDADPDASIDAGVDSGTDAGKDAGDGGPNLWKCVPQY